MAFPKRKKLQTRRNNRSRKLLCNRQRNSNPRLRSDRNPNHVMKSKTAMRIFHNKETNHIIVVCDNKAWSLYGYENDHPADLARQFRDGRDGPFTLTHPCIEIELPAIDEIEPDLLEQYRPYENKDTETEREWKGTKCGPSPSTNKSQSSITSIPNSTRTTETTHSSKTQPKPSKNGSKLETSQ